MIDVAFQATDGVTLHGVLHLPDGMTTPAPGVVMAHGFSAVKEMGLPAYAEAFAAAGIATLVYDHRNLGASDGEPRGEINPWAQSRDYRTAIGWLANRPEVDADRLGLWGSSFSGGEVIVVASVDDRVKAVVANVPFAGTPGGDTSDEVFEAIRANLTATDGSGLADDGGDTMGPFAVVREGDTELTVFLDQPESAEWFLASGKGTSWSNQVTLRNAFGTEPPFNPGACIAHIAPRPLLMVVATDDRVAATEVALESYQHAGEPKRLEMIDGHHFTPYSGDALAMASGAARDFFVEYL